MTGIVALLAAGCTSSQHAGAAKETSATTPRQAILLAAEHARLATSFSGSMSMTITGAAEMTMSGTMSVQTRPTLLVTADLSTVVSGGQSVPGGISEIITSKGIYLKMSELSKASGKAWVELPFSEFNGLAGLDLGPMIQQAEGENPLVETQMLASSTDVREIGGGSIDGTAVTEYAGSYPMAAAIARLPAGSRAAAQKDIAVAGFTSATFSIWLDAQQQVRKLNLTEHGTAGNLVLSELVTSINQPVTVQLPAASQVATLPASDLESDQ
jgi:hypothetical protein